MTVNETPFSLTCLADDARVGGEAAAPGVVRQYYDGISSGLAAFAREEEPPEKRLHAEHGEVVPAGGVDVCPFGADSSAAQIHDLVLVGHQPGESLGHVWRVALTAFHGAAKVQEIRIGERERHVG